MNLTVTPHKEREEETHVESHRAQVTACDRGRVLDKGKPPQAKGRPRMGETSDCLPGRSTVELFRADTVAAALRLRSFLMFVG